MPKSKQNGSKAESRKVPQDTDTLQSTLASYLSNSKVVLGLVLSGVAVVVVVVTIATAASTVSESEAGKKGGDAGTISTEGTSYSTETSSPEKSSQLKALEMIADLIDQDRAYDTGNYAVGTIQPGEYAFISLNSGGMYYSEEDLSGNIIDNEIFSSFGWVYVHGVGNVDTSGVLVRQDDFASLGVASAKELYLILNNLNVDYNQSGYYKVGVDIQQGQYMLTSTGDGYASLNTGPVGNSEIIDNELFNGTYSIFLIDGQYFELSRAVYEVQS